MQRVIEAISPARLGVRFRWLLASSWVSNLGDGIALAAGPLLIASETRNPSMVALATLLQHLPWLLFGLYSGVVADRTDRRRFVVAVNGARALVLIFLATLVMVDRVNITVVFAALFLLGTAETFADNTTDTLLPMVLDKRDLGLGNARMIFGYRTINDLLGVPIGAVLFGLGMFLPFATQALLILLSALLVFQIGDTPALAPRVKSGVLADISTGARWLWNHAPMRTLALTIFGFNITYGAAWSVLVLYALEQLEAGEIGFGLLTASAGFGGTLGAAAYARLEARFPLANLMRASLTGEALTHLALANLTSASLAMVVMAVFGFQTSVWSATARAVRQRAVPIELQGRVGSVYVTGLKAGLVIGAAIGGAVASRGGISAPFWFGFVGSVAMLWMVWNRLTDVAHEDTITK